MTGQHPSEYELQQFALLPKSSTTEMIEHIAACEQCSSIVHHYQQVFVAVKQMEQPILDFDVNAVVMQQLTEAKKGRVWDKAFTYLAGFTAAGMLTIAWFLFAPSFAGLFAGVGRLLVYLLIATGLLVLILQCVDLLKRYKEKLDRLEFY